MNPEMQGLHPTQIQDLKLGYLVDLRKKGNITLGWGWGSGRGWLNWAWIYLNVMVLFMFIIRLCDALKYRLMEYLFCNKFTPSMKSLIMQ